MSKGLRLVVSVALLSVLGWRMDWPGLGRAFAGLRLELWLAALGLYLATQLASAVRWQWLARPLGFDRPLRQYVRDYFIGMYFNLLLPTSVGGDVVRALYLDGGTGRRLAALLSVLVDRASGLVVLLALACAAVVCCPVALPAWVPASVWGAAGCGVLGAAVAPWVARRGRRFARLASLVDGAKRYLGRPRLILASTALSLFVQSANVVLVWLVGLAVGAPVPAGYYWIVVPMVTLLTMAPVSLNGMGVREGGMVLFLAPLGVPEATAVSLALLWFAVFTAASLCGAGVYLLGSLNPPRERADEPVRVDPHQGRARQPQAAA